MLKTWLRHLIYEISIDVLFGELYQNFMFPSMDLSPTLLPLEQLKKMGHIDDYRIYYDPNVGAIRVHITTDNPATTMAIYHLFNIKTLDEDSQ